MAGRRPSLFRLLLGNVWFIICLVAASSCLALTLQLLLRVPPFDEGRAHVQLAFGVPALFGGLAGLYGIVATSLLALRKSRMNDLSHRTGQLQRQIDKLKSTQLDQRARLDELSTLREVATVVNQESDFSIIAEKALELIDGLLEPDEATIFLRDENDDDLRPFAQYADGAFLGEEKVLTRSIPDFDPSEFESHSVLCRVHGQELHAVVPMKVEEKILGALFLVFPTDSRPPEAQTAHFNRTRRRLLTEIAHHISLAVKTKHLHTRAVVDSLTRLYSRSHFNTQIQAALDYARRGDETFSLVMLDIDHFKKINDSYGHDTGDVILRTLANRIRRRLRKYDTAYRYGGEEIAVLLPRTRLEEALGIAERLRAAVEDQQFRGAENDLIGVTISVGVAQFKPEDDAEGLFHRADQRLYNAKRNGRNQVRPRAA